MYELEDAVVPVVRFRSARGSEVECSKKLEQFEDSIIPRGSQEGYGLPRNLAVRTQQKCS